MYSEHIKEFEEISCVIHKKAKDILLFGLDQSIVMPHLVLISYIKQVGISTVSDVANHLGVTSSAITYLVNKLVELGLVTRIRSDIDRRIVEVGLTLSGEEALKQFDKNRVKLYDKCFSNIDKSEVSQFFNVIKKITSNITND